MEIKYKLYPYPVLWNKNDDYKEPSIFLAEITPIQEIRRIKLRINFSLIDEEIEKLIKENKAEYVMHIEATSTYFRELISTRELQIDYILKEGDILGKIQVSFFILAKENIINYRNKNFNEDYSDGSFELKKGSIIAIADGYRFDVEKDNHMFAEAPSIFTIYKRETTEQIGMLIETNSNKIRIGLNITDYMNYNYLVASENNMNVVNSIIIFPALIYTFEQLKNDFNEV